MEQVSTITIKIVKTIIMAVRTYIEAFAFAAILAIGLFITYMIFTRLLPWAIGKLLGMIFEQIKVAFAKKPQLNTRDQNVKFLSAKDARRIKDAHKDIRLDEEDSDEDEGDEDYNEDEDLDDDQSKVEGPTMKKHQIAAIIGGVVLSVVSFLPVFITISSGYRLAHPQVIKVFLYPILGVSVAVVIVFLSFFKGDRGE